MAGILDNKKRILDTIITDVGRKQMFNGKLRIEFASFTDARSFYEPDSKSGSTDASKRIYFEETNLPQDLIVFETDDSGFMLPINREDISFVNGKILSGSDRTKLNILPPNSSKFNNAANKLVESSVQNFNQLNLIGTEDPFLDNNNFTLSQDNFEFQMTKDAISDLNIIEEVEVEDADSLFEDARLANALNFQYLPPINKKNADEDTSVPLGNYPKFRTQDKLTLKDIKSMVKNKQKASFELTDSSVSSNLLCQFFETTTNSFQKLSTYDAGLFFDEETQTEKRVYFVGKIFNDKHGHNTYVNLFTIIFE